MPYRKYISSVERISRYRVLTVDEDNEDDLGEGMDLTEMGKELRERCRWRTVLYEGTLGCAGQVNRLIYWA